MLEAEITHTMDTCLRLALVQDKRFGRTRRVVRGVIALLPILLGCAVGLENLWGILLLVLGVVLYWTSGHMYERDAEKAFRMTPEKYRRVKYYFRDRDMLVEAGGTQKAVGYGEILALITDGSYYYLFINPQQAYMMELRKPTRRESERFEDFLREKTGRKWKVVIARRPFPRLAARRRGGDGSP